MQQEIQQPFLVTTLAHRWQRHLQAIEPVVQILTETALLHPLQQIPVGGTDDAHIHRLRLTANRHHLALFQHPQQAGLQRQWHIANLVQQQSTAVGLQQLATHALLARPGEAATAVAEQLTFDQALGDRRTVDRHERLATALAGLVHGLGKGFFTATGLAAQQQRHIALEHTHGTLKIVLQGRVQQADTRRCGRPGLGLAGRHRPSRRLRLAAQAGEHLASITGAQRPDRTAAWRSAAEQLVVAAGEEHLQRFAQHAPANGAEQVQRTLVGGADPAIAIERQQPFTELADRLRLHVDAQQPLLLEMTQEIAALDHLRRKVHQRHGVELALARHVRPRRGHIEHRQQFTMGVEHRARRAGQPGMAAAKVLILVNGQGLALDQAGADAIGTLACLAPVRAQPQPGTLEVAPLAGCGDTVEDHPTGVGQQHRMAGSRQLLVQAVHFAVGDFQHLAQALAALQQAAVLKHHRCLDH